MLRSRLLSSIGLIAVLIVVGFSSASWAAPLAVLLGIVLVVGGLREFLTLTGSLGAPGFPRLTTGFGIAYMLSIWGVAAWGAPVGVQAAVFDGAVFVFMAAGFLLVFRCPDYAVGVRNLLASLAAFLYLPWLLGFLVRIYFLADPKGGNGHYFVFFLILGTKVGDIGGYVCGKLSARLPRGNHRLGSRLSPKKTWEGVIGSLVFSVLVCTGLAAIAGDRLNIGGRPVIPVLGAIVLGAVLALVGLFGDLTESSLKRAAGVKDSGASMPGFGGVLDTIDSLLFAAPLFYCYLTFAGWAVTPR